MFLSAWLLERTRLFGIFFFFPGLYLPLALSVFELVNAQPKKWLEADHQAILQN